MPRTDPTRPRVHRAAAAADDRAAPWRALPESARRRTVARTWYDADAQGRNPAAAPRRGCATMRWNTEGRKGANPTTVKFPGRAAYTAAKFVRARARARCFAMSIPPISTLPVVAASTPSTMLMVVVLPAPFGPSRPTTSPRPTVKKIRHHRYSRSSCQVPYRRPDFPGQ